VSFASALPPTQVLVFESTICGLCAQFNTRDVKSMVAVNEYANVVNMTILPLIHLSETRLPNGSYNYTHAFGDEYLVKAKFAFCVNNLYPQDRALKWAAYWESQSGTIYVSAKNFFTEDQGAKVTACAAGSQVNNYIHAGMLVLYTHSFSGMLPGINVNNAQYTRPNNNDLFLVQMCRLRADKTSQPACKGVNSTEISFLSTEWAEEMNVVPSESVVDYDKFWNSDDDVPEVKTAEKVVVDYDKFWNSNDE